MDRPGTGTIGDAGARANPVVLWSGYVTCWWRRAPIAVDRVAGFHVPITDPTFSGLRWPDNSVAGQVEFQGGASRGGTYWTQIGDEQPFVVRVESVSTDGSTGAVITGPLGATGTVIRFVWSCGVDP